jgi:uncharacterized protein
MTRSAQVNSVILKAASRCNLSCRYCYIYQHEDQSWRDRPALMPEAVYRAVLLRMREHCDTHGHRMSLLLHGGEPLLVGRARFARMVAEARDVLGPRLRRIGVQTNAALIGPAWADLLARSNIDISVSLDGPADINDAVRIDRRGRGSYAAILAGIDALRTRGIEPYVLCVITPGASGLDIFRHFLSLGLRRFDFLLPDVSHDNKAAFYGSVGPTPVARYLLPILDDWLARDDPQIEIRLFVNLLSILMGGPPASDIFGNVPLSYLVVDTDGEIQALDALRVCAPQAGFSGLNVLSRGFDDLEQGSPLAHRAVGGLVPVPTACRDCPHLTVCGGGYLPHRYSRTRDFDNPSVWCEDIKLLLTDMMARIERDAAV